MQKYKYIKVTSIKLRCDESERRTDFFMVPRTAFKLPMPCCSQRARRGPITVMSVSQNRKYYVIKLQIHQKERFLKWMKGYFERRLVKRGVTILDVDVLDVVLVGLAVGMDELSDSEVGLLVGKVSEVLLHETKGKQ